MLLGAGKFICTNNLFAARVTKLLSNKGSISNSPLAFLSKRTLVDVMEYRSQYFPNIPSGRVRSLSEFSFDGGGGTAIPGNPRVGADGGGGGSGQGGGGTLIELRQNRLQIIIVTRKS